MSSSLFVLGLHNVDPTWCFPSKGDWGRRGLQQQLRFLRRTCNVVPLGPAVDALRAGEPLPPRAVAITFDDGYADNAEIAVPMLERLGLPATFFLSPELLSGEVRAWWEVVAWAFRDATTYVVRWNGSDHRLTDHASRRALVRTVKADLKQVDGERRDALTDDLLRQLSPRGEGPTPALFMDWSAARDVSARGFEIGSHSQRHLILSRETSEAQSWDLRESRSRLEAGLGRPVTLLAYPNGTSSDFDLNTIEGAEAAGYTAAVTTIDGINRQSTPPYALLRSVISPQRGVADLARSYLRGIRHESGREAPRDRSLV